MDVTTYVTIATAFLVSCIFPFVFHFFKKNEKLHEETKAKVGQHDTTITLHEYRLHALEQWRLMTPGQAVNSTTTSVTETRV